MRKIKTPYVFKIEMEKKGEKNQNLGKKSMNQIMSEKITCQ